VIFRFKVPDKFRELSEAMREAGKDSWKACLVRIDRSSKDVSIDFEYDHPEKWLIVPPPSGRWPKRCGRFSRKKRSAARKIRADGFISVRGDARFPQGTRGFPVPSAAPNRIGREATR
jgi:hypothetical protein